MKKFIYDNRFKIIDIACVVFITSIFIIWVFRITADMNNILAGPDEAMRYIIPNFIYEHGRLPDGYETAIHGNWSYAFYPQLLGAIISAGYMHIASLFTHDPEWLVRAARLTSVLFGVIAAVFIRRSTRILLGSAKHKDAISNLAMFMFALLPQVTFLSSYVNNDIIALAGISIIVYACIYIAKKGITSIILGWFSVGATIAILGYLNSYGFVLVSFLYVFVNIIESYRKIRDRNILQAQLAIIIGIPVLVCLPFFIRNALLYHGDIFGLKSFRDAYSVWVAQTGQELQFSFKGGLVQLIVGTRWVFDTIKSFIMGYFGGWGKGVSSLQYYVYYGIILLGLGGFMLRVRKSKFTKEIWLFVSMLVAGSILTIALSLYYTLSIDYQPQGRYVIYLAIPLTIALAIGFAELIKKFIKPKFVSSTIIATIVVFVLIHTSIMYKSLF